MSRRTEIALFCAVLLLAGVLRLGWPELTEFKRDEAHVYGLALDLAEFKALPLRGIGSSVGLPNSPVSVYLFALPLCLWKSPLAATLFVGALNTASVALAYAMTRRYWGARAALFAALLYAAAPWAVIYSRKIWAQNLLPLFVTGYAFTALLAFVEGRRRWLSAHLVLLAISAQLHYAALTLIPLTALLMWLFRRNVDWRALGWGIAAALLTMLPFALYVAMQGGHSAGRLELLARPVQISADALTLSALVMLGTELHSLAGPLAFRDYLATIPDLSPLLYLGGLLVLAGFLMTLWTWRRHRTSAGSSVKHEAALVLALWLALPIVVFIPHTTPIFPHYFIVLFPAPFVLAGIFLDALLRRFPSRTFQLIGGLVPLAIAAGQVWTFAALLNFVSARATPGGFGVPLGYLLRVAALAQSAPDVLVVSEGADPRVDETPAVFHVLLRGVPHRFVDGRTTAVLPAGEAMVILWPGAQPLPGEAAYRAWGGGQWSSVLPLRAGEGDVRAVTGSGVGPGVPRVREASALLSNGAEIVGSGGDSALWQLWWRAAEVGAAEDVTLFAHLLDANGRRVAQADVPTYPTSGWRAGDWVVSYFPLNAEGVMVRAGMYDSLTHTPVDVLDAGGQPAGPWVEFALEGEP